VLDAFAAMATAAKSARRLDAAERLADVVVQVASAGTWIR
jgi:hypothetical protein